MLSKLSQLFSTPRHRVPNTTVTEPEIREALSSLIDPNTGKSYESAKAIRTIDCTEAELRLELILAYPANSQFQAIRDTFTHTLAPLIGNRQLTIQLTSQIVAHTAQPGVPLLNGVKNTIVIASGKGGVGKSTTAVNLALALSAEGARVGILDADIYGPSQPLMMGLQGQRPETIDNQHFKPIINYGIQTMSIGYLVNNDQAMVWRGPMVSQALQQLLRDTQWDQLDYLVIDMPPGTGDTQLTLAQKIPVTGAVIVTTPQDIALLDAIKGLKMFEKVNIPIVGIVENMALHTCSHCGHTEPIFGTGGAKRMALEYGAPVLGSLPLDMGIRMATDEGKPTVVAEPNGQITHLYKAIARRIAVHIAEKALDFSHKFPKIVVQKS